MNAAKPLDKEITFYLTHLNTQQKKAVLSVVKSFAVQEESSDWWDDLPANVQNEIDQSLADLDNGKGIPHEVVVKKYKKWFAR